jgi:hypothetical protein
MAVPLPEPRDAVTGTKERFLAYLDFYRSTVVSKLDGMSDTDLRESRLPSGWAPLELLKHLIHMEQRWMVWGFNGEDVADPWGEDGPDGRWAVGESDSLGSLVERLHAVAARTREIATASELLQRGVPGGRFDEDPTPTLEWILFHVLQEYARHAGHLDIVRELVDGTTGE